MQLTLVSTLDHSLGNLRAPTAAFTTRWGPISTNRRHHRTPLRKLPPKVHDVLRACDVVFKTKCVPEDPCTLMTRQITENCAIYSSSLCRQHLARPSVKLACNTRSPIHGTHRPFQDVISRRTNTVGTP